MPNTNDVKLMQFSDREGQMIAGFTPEHAVYDTNGIRLDVKLQALDVDRIMALLQRASVGGNGISAIFQVGNNESAFMSAVEETMRNVNEGTSAVGGLAYNTYLAVLAIDFYNFMDIEISEENNTTAYALAVISMGTDGGYNVKFDLGFDTYRYYFNKTIVDLEGQPQSKLYYEERGIEI